MKNILKVWLKRNYLTNDFNAHVAVAGNKELTDIVDEMINDGITTNREVLLDIINRFNRKSADLLLSGHNVNNGLVNMRSFVKGPLNDKKWNPDCNWVDINISNGKELYDAIAETTVEILGEKGETIDPGHPSYQTSQFSGSSRNNDLHISLNEPKQKIEKEPACGIAFRRWLCNA